MLIESQDLYVALADADAAASTAYLEAGLESQELRDRYDDDIAVAGERLAAIVGHGTVSESARGDLELITEQLPVYSSLVATARTNNRQDFPVGAAYLRQASKLMREEILPAALGIYSEAAAQLHAGYRDGTSEAEVWVWAGVAAVVVAALLSTQFFVARRTRRLLNLGLLAATVLVVGLAAWTVNALMQERHALVAAEREGSDHFLVLSTARILTLRAMADENLDLIERGTEPTYMADFDTAVSAIGDESSGLLGWAGDIADDTGIGAGSIAQILQGHERFLAVHDEVRSNESRGEYNAAVDLAVGQEADAAARLDNAYVDFTGGAHNRLRDSAADARQALRGLPTALAVVAVGAGLLAVVGLDRRIREYR